MSRSAADAPRYSPDEVFEIKRTRGMASCALFNESVITGRLSHRHSRRRAGEGGFDRLIGLLFCVAHFNTRTDLIGSGIVDYSIERPKARVLFCEKQSGFNLSSASEKLRQLPL